MPGHGVDHSSPFPGRRAPAADPERSLGLEPGRTRQNFRKLTRQNFRDRQMFPLVIWCSLVPPLPSLLVSQLVDGRIDLVATFHRASWLSVGAVLYLAIFGTILSYASWGYLLQRYSTGLVTPFALLSPCTGVVAAALLLGESFGPLRMFGMALILCGLTVIVLPAYRTDRVASKMVTRRP